MVRCKKECVLPGMYIWRAKTWKDHWRAAKRGEGLADFKMAFRHLTVCVDSSPLALVPADQDMLTVYFKKWLLLLKSVFSVYSIHRKEYLFKTARETLYHGERENGDSQPIQIHWTID